MFEPFVSIHLSFIIRDGLSKEKVKAPFKINGLAFSFFFQHMHNTEYFERLRNSYSYIKKLVFEVKLKMQLQKVPFRVQNGILIHDTIQEKVDFFHREENLCYLNIYYIQAFFVNLYYIYIFYPTIPSDCFVFFNISLYVSSKSISTCSFITCSIRLSISCKIFIKSDL